MNWHEGGELKPGSPPVIVNIPRKPNPGDFVFKHLTLLFAGLVFSLVFVMAYEMYKGSAPAISKFGWSFLSSTLWDPVQDQYGALAYVFGTVASSALALVFAVPLGIAVAILLSELMPKWAEVPLSFLVELLAAIPSIVYGLWGIFVLVPWLRTTVEPILSRSLGFLPFFSGPHYGFGMLAAGIILAIMILPTIISISVDSLQAVPPSYREGSIALGATRWQTVKMVLFPAARSGIIASIILGMGRAIGETMATIMIAGNAAEVPRSLLAPVRTLTSNIALEMSYATGEHREALVATGVVLFVIIMVLNTIANATASRRRKQ